MHTMEKHVSIVPIWLKQKVVDLLLNDQLLHHSPFSHFSLANVNLWVNTFGWYIYVHISKPHDSYLCTLI